MNTTELEIRLPTQPDTQVSPDTKISITLPLELASKTSLANAVETGNVGLINEELSRLLQSTEVNRLHAVRRVVQQLQQIEDKDFEYKSSEIHQDELSQFFAHEAQSLFEQFSSMHLEKDVIQERAVNELYEKVVNIRSIFRVIYVLGFISSFKYRNLGEYCSEQLEKCLNPTTTFVLLQKLEKDITDKYDKLLSI